MGFPLAKGETFSHSREAQGRAVTAPHQKEPARLLGKVFQPGISYREKAPRSIQDTLQTL